MNLFEKIFKKSSQKTSVNQFEMLTGYKAVFTSYDGGIYESELCRSAINTIATHCSKLTPEVVGNDKDVYKVITKPNEFMTASQFLYRAATILNTQNTCFIVPMEDKYGEINGLFPILPSECEVVYDDYNQLWLNYRFSGGKRGIIELDRVGVLKKHYYKNDVFGENNEALRPTMQLIKTQQTGIEEGIKSSANYTFMASMANFASDPDIA
ncbi:MAG: phage portal protein, partial [Oscillospiraceae bacterium]